MSASDQQVFDQVQLLRTALESAKTKLGEQKEMLEQLTSPPFAYATVVAMSHGNKVSRAKRNFKAGARVRAYRGPHRGRVGVIREIDNQGMAHVDLNDGQTKVPFHATCECTEEYALEVFVEPFGTAVIVIEGKFLEVLLPKDKTINPGDTVTVVAETMQIVDVASVQVGGNIGFLRRVIDETFSEVDYESSVRVVFNGKFGQLLDKGDRVVLDGTASVVVRNLGKEDERFSFTTETNVSWEDVGGLAEAKRQMIEAVELPHTNPEIFKFYGKRPIKGILLYGAPGCGKTMLGKATATALARIYNGNGSSSGFIYIKGPEILDRFVGVAEATVRQIFQRARKHKQTYGYPAVIFIDEADAILAKRGSGVSSDVERTIVPMFLTEMDGLEESGALVILATNRSDILDPAVVRDGRIDRKIKIERPTKDGALEIFKLNLKGVPLNNGYSRGELATLGAEELFNPKRILYQVSTRSQGVCNFTLGHIVNGGMIVNTLEQATSIAMHRDLGKRKPEGLRKDDLVAAVDAIERQNRDLNHTDDLSEFVHDFRDDVLNINRLRQATA